MNLARIKFLGIYLIVICAFQICLYVVLYLTPDKNGWLFYFDPRIGIFFLESILRHEEQTVPSLIRWFSLGWILSLGISMFFGRPLIKTYIASEIILALPSLLFGVFVTLINLNPREGFSVGELFYPLIIMIFFSVVPLVLAFLLLWKSRLKSEVEIFGEKNINA